MRRRKEEPQINYLDLIPERFPEIRWSTDFKKRVVLEIENTGLFNRIAQKVFGKPRYTKVHLDAQGTHLWPLIDGKKTVMELAALQKERFGEEAEPLYSRIVKYFQILESYQFIRFVNKPEKNN